MSDRGLISKTDKEFSKVNKKEKNVGQRFEQTRPKMTYRGQISTCKDAPCHESLGNTVSLHTEIMNG